MTASSNRILLVGAKTTNGATLSGVTYNGSSLTNFNTYGTHKTYRLIAPATGSNTLTVSYSGYSSSYFKAASFSGVDQTVPLGTEVTNSGTDNSPSTGSITCPGSGMIWGWEHGAYSTALPTIGGSGNTLAGAARSGGGGQTLAGAYRSTTGSVAWTLANGGSFGWEVLGVPINPYIAPNPRNGDMNFMGI